MPLTVTRGSLSTLGAALQSIQHCLNCSEANGPFFFLFTSSSLKRSNTQLFPRICPLHAYLHKYQAPEVCAPSHTMPVSKSTKAVGAEIFFRWELSVATCLTTRDPWMPRSDYCLVIPPALALIDVATVSVIRAVLLVGANDDTVLGYKEDAVLGLRAVS